MTWKNQTGGYFFCLYLGGGLAKEKEIARKVSTMEMILLHKRCKDSVNFYHNLNVHKKLAFIWKPNLLGSFVRLFLLFFLSHQYFHLETRAVCVWHPPRRLPSSKRQKRGKKTEKRKISTSLQFVITFA